MLIPTNATPKVPAAAAAPAAVAPAPVQADTARFDTSVRKEIEEDTKINLRAMDRAWVRLGTAAELAPGASRVEDLGGPKVAVFNVDGVIHVISNECGHQGGPLGEGKLEGFSVVCPWHQWKFDVTTLSLVQPLARASRPIASASPCVEYGSASKQMTR